MVAAKLMAVAGLASLASAIPVAQLAERANIDVTILQFALTLEHLEHNFYDGALNKFTVQDFQNEGFSADDYNNLKTISYDEYQHVQLLKGAISAAGYAPVKACTYSFPYTNVTTFTTLSSILEGVGTSAYLGAAPLITNKQYLTVAGAILAVEALHTATQRIAINENPSPTILYTPLDGSSAYSLAAMFITSCPASNPALPFTDFPNLSLVSAQGRCEEPSCAASYHSKRHGGEREGGEGHGWHWSPDSGDKSSLAPPSPGATVVLQAANAIPAGSYVTFVNALTVTSVKGAISGKSVSVKIPAGLAGQTYAFVTKSDVESTFSDAAVLFGPAIIEVNPGSQVSPGVTN